MSHDPGVKNPALVLNIKLILHVFGTAGECVCVERSGVRYLEKTRVHSGRTGEKRQRIEPVIVVLLSKHALTTSSTVWPHFTLIETKCYNLML